jgi:hypothetical protein
MVPSVAIVTPTPPPAPSLELPLTPDVAAESPPASAPPVSAIVRQPPELALTGGSSTDLVTMAIGLMAIGTVLTRLRPRGR